MIRSEADDGITHHADDHTLARVEALERECEELRDHIKLSREQRERLIDRAQLTASMMRSKSDHIVSLMKDNEALREDMAEWEKDVADAMAGACTGGGDEAHCACVPALKIGMARLAERAINAEHEELRLRRVAGEQRERSDKSERENETLRALLRESADCIEEFNSDVYQDEPILSTRIRAALERKHKKGSL